MDETLVRRHEPVLRFAQGENFFPMPVETFIEQCSLHLFRDEGGDLYIPPGYMLPDYLGEPELSTPAHYLVYAARTPADEEKARVMQMVLERQATVRGPEFLEFVRDRLQEAAMNLVRAGAQKLQPFHLDRAVFERALRNYGGFAAHTPTYYYRLSEDNGYTVIQYWYFYAYNDFATNHGGINDHEGDWESVHVFLRDGEPRWVVPSAHGGHGEEARRPWDPDQIELEGGRPVIYVAPGSHANYFTPHGAESFVPGERVVGAPGHPPWGPPRPLEQPWFTEYRGRWGARIWDKISQRLGDARGGSPTGPRFTRSGQLRVEWEHPARYAGLA